MNRKHQLLREFFLNALTIALVKQIIVSGASERSAEDTGANEDGQSADVPPYFLG